jgi:hypothetical protein
VNRRKNNLMNVRDLKMSVWKGVMSTGLEEVRLPGYKST